MKITIPAGSLIVMPKQNTPELVFKTTVPVTVEQEDVEIFENWEEYLKCQDS